MAKDNITYPSLITIGKTFVSKITNDIVDGSTMSNQLVHVSPIGIEDVITNWILATGFWNDSGIWIDDEFWID